MYLFVFVFLLMATMSVYVEVHGLQSEKIFNNQTGFAELMIKWHVAAKNLVKQNTSVGIGAACSLSDNLTIPVRCSDLVNGIPYYVVPLPGTPLSGYPNYAGLPDGYNYTNYQWNSIVYRPSVGGPRYVVTYASPDGAGMVSQPNTTGISVGDLMRQLVRLKLDPSVYGYVQSGGIQITNLGLIPHPSPPLPIGSVVLISSF